MKLTDLNPRWVVHGGPDVRDKDGNEIPLRERIGLSCDCPCGACPDPLFVAFTNPPDGGPPVGRTTWQRTGETFETLTLTPSIQRVGGCAWHGFLTNGEFTSC